MATSYKDLGLVNTKELFAKAIKGGYAIPAYNFNNMEQMQAILQACVETQSPVILQVSKGAREYANQTLLRYMARSSTPRKSLPTARVFRSCCTSITARISRPARAASTTASAR